MTGLKVASPPWAFLSGVRTAVKNSGLKIVLASYDGVAVDGVERVDAASVLPERQCLAYLASGVHVQSLFGLHSIEVGAG